MWMSILRPEITGKHSSKAWKYNYLFKNQKYTNYRSKVRARFLHLSCQGWGRFAPLSPVSYVTMRSITEPRWLFHRRENWQRSRSSGDMHMTLPKWSLNEEKTCFLDRFGNLWMQNISPCLRRGSRKTQRLWRHTTVSCTTSRSTGYA